MIYIYFSTVTIVCITFFMTVLFKVARNKKKTKYENLLWIHTSQH